MEYEQLVEKVKKLEAEMRELRKHNKKYNPRNIIGQDIEVQGDIYGRNLYRKDGNGRFQKVV